MKGNNFTLIIASLTVETNFALTSNVKHDLGKVMGLKLLLESLNYKTWIFFQKFECQDR